MPLFLPPTLPALDILSSGGFSVKPAQSMPAGRLRVLFLNLMPEKAAAEVQLMRQLAWDDMDVELIPIKIPGQTYNTTPPAYMQEHYIEFVPSFPGQLVGKGPSMRLHSGDRLALVINGAPVELLPFEQVRYWKQLCQIMDWAAARRIPTLYICWGAQAGLFHRYGIPKYALAQKCFGVYPMEGKNNVPLLRGLPKTFMMPHSRRSEVRAADILWQPQLLLAADNAEVGVGMVASRDGRETFIFGHMEYEATRLDMEYHRDRARGKHIAPPQNYYDTEGNIVFSWHDAARTLFRNWLRS